MVKDAHTMGLNTIKKRYYLVTVFGQLTDHLYPLSCFTMCYKTWDVGVVKPSVSHYSSSEKVLTKFET
jgi:hypothetical protein